MKTYKKSSMKKKKVISKTATYAFLVILSLVWITPVFLIALTSLRKGVGQPATFWPTDGITFEHYVNLFVGETAKLYPYLDWILNTLYVSVFSTIISLFFILSVSYTMSRLRFKSRKKLMSINLILGMFPGFMAMIAVYNILKLVGMTQKLEALILVYSASSGMGFYIAKGFFDTIPKSLDEAARIDGATNFKIFYKIIIPLSKPIIIYTLITTFMGPWVDYIFSSMIMGASPDPRNYTVALGLYKMLNGSPGNINLYYTKFFAGATLISIPIMLVFLFTQKFYISGVTGGAVKG